jgi:hypothetical protein
MIAAIAVRRMYRAIVRIALTIKHTSLLDPELYERHHEDGCEQDKGERCRLSHLKELERILVDLVAHRECRVRRSPFGEDVRLLKHLERIEQRDDNVEERRG